MDRSKIVAVITGAIALLLGIAYLVMVQLLDFRGEMLPAPVDLSEVDGSQPALVQPASSSSPLSP
ncbi:hypothetical protein H6F88_29485 [Oculatella sp. FACHB-28]|uniref:hypothetical protein n=1 Tax=Cyanophyceae TaxID=3028117 RepID=UPI00168738EF|nr:MULTISPECIES: hypothetical protein [Cyanophyceae]MBD1868535.1 hypothetical protein [Cyanobacteria bacterium FACHB-471]MBD2000495.1 hypothetical protein [Leptolyngbya sp. FACHB-541]MBD2060077.1 hypothetical protein [Oculatella sp. FACHB-28]MBD2066760.1 hypothetical protein [Leptolyngbya sp. FACHB-671]